MANKYFVDLLKVDIQTLISESKSIDKINHAGLKGNIREFGFGKLLSKYLPQEWEIGKGQIHDSEGNESAETDLLIYNKNFLPPVLFGETVGFYPLDSTKYSIEIKTKSTATEIKSTINKFETLLKLKKISKEDKSLIHRVYFALSSDLKDSSELERYKKYDKNFYTTPAINIILVLGQGYWYHSLEIGEKNYGHWKFHEAMEDNYELAFLLGGIINTLNKGKPAFGHYILPEGNMNIVDRSQI